jgi:surface carbohydrate biosynthesis protein
MRNHSAGRTHVFLPVEIKVREFHGKLLLALTAAEAGFRVVLGGQRELRRRLHMFPPGIYIDKSVAVSKNRWFGRFRRLGNVIAAWDEEGLVIHEEQYLKSRFSSQAFGLVEKFFAWGPVQRDILARAVPDRKDDILLAGNPRFDMLRPELRSFYSPAADRLNDEHGPVILVNTNFGFCNHFKGVDEAKNLFMHSTSHGSEKFIDEWIDFQQRLFTFFVDAVPWLSSRFPDHSIIVRPHPSEGDSVWLQVADRLPNVRVSKQGNVLEWIIASDAVIHSNCTTGIEAYLMGVPSIAYRPVLSDRYETYLPNSVSNSVFSPDELQETMIDIIDGGNAGRYIHNKEAKKVADRYISHTEGMLSSDCIVESLMPIQAGAGRGDFSSSSRLFQTWVERARSVKDTAQSVLPAYRHAAQYDKQKFTGITPEEIEELIKVFRQVTGRFSRIRFTRSGKSCFIIESGKAGS